MPRVVGRERRRRDVVAAPPDFRLRLAVFRGGLRFVQPLQRAVVPFVQPPVLFDGNPEQVELVERDPARAHRALEHRRVGDVENEAGVAQQLTGRDRFVAALIAQIHVGPTRETVLFVPGAFPVPEQYDSIHPDPRRVDLRGLANRLTSGERRGRAERAFDAQQLVVFGRAIRRGSPSRS